jgi:hypothetical protein
MRHSETGSHVTQLQQRLKAAGILVSIDGWYGPATETAVKLFQQQAGLVVDGQAGPKTIAALINGKKNALHLSEQDLEKAAAELDVQLAAIKAINAIETKGCGFLDDGRPIILYERHIAFRRLGESGLDFPQALALADRYPNLISQKRGGYTGGPAEWSRLASARQALSEWPDIPHEACSWGQFQIMGFHWETLGYSSCAEFVCQMCTTEAAQLDAFVRFIKADPTLHKALKSLKWAEVAKIYNGPAYKDNFYDIKLARAFAEFLPEAVST